MWVCPLQVKITSDILLIGAPNRIVFDEVKEKCLALIEEFFEENSFYGIRCVRLYVLGEITVQYAPIAPIANVAAVKSGHAPLAGDLQPDFTFGNFIIGKSNQLAEAAAEQVALAPGKTYNPLFLYGSVGLGKTHLLHAIGNRIKENQPQLNVRYFQAERFVSDLIKAIQQNTLEDLKSIYRKIDVLMIDDIQFFAGKERTQEEFFHTFNTLIDSRQQVILTSDRFPKDLGGIAERLKSRFGSGLTVAVDPPDLETRVAILVQKSHNMGQVLSHTEAFFIAQHVRTNIRELEGAFKKVLAYSRFKSQPISLDLIQEALKDVIASHQQSTSVSNIMDKVAQRYGVSVKDLVGDARFKKFTGPRQVAMALCKELTKMSFPEIAKSFGGRDHTTVIHACKKVGSQLKVDSDLSKDYQELIKNLCH